MAWVNGRFVLSGADVVFNYGSGAPAKIGLGTELTAMRIENNSQGVYGLNTDNDAYPQGIEPLQFGGAWELKTEVASESFLTWLGQNVMADVSPKYTEFYFTKDVYPETDLKMYAMKFAFVRSLEISAREGDHVSLTSSGFFRVLEEVTESSPVREKDNAPIIPATFAHSLITLNGITHKNVVRGFTVSLDTGIEPIYSFAGREFAGVRCGRKVVRATISMILEKSEFELVGGTKLLSLATKKQGYTVYNPAFIEDATVTLGWGAGNHTLTLDDVLIDRFSISARPNDLVSVDMDLLVRKIIFGSGGGAQ